MALDVQCGCASKIEIVRTNSLTGEVTGVFPQSNIWTDAGLARISGYVTGDSAADWPSYLHYGSGAHVAPHNGVTRLANRIGDAAWGGSSNATYPDLDTVLVTRTASITVAARGVAWVLSELGLSTGGGANANLDTYSLTKIDGVPAPIPVAAIEILTITYTVQIQYPRRLPPQPMPFDGGPETTATFSIPGTDVEAYRRAIRSNTTGGNVTEFYLYTNASGGNSVRGGNSGNDCVWSATSAVRLNTHAGLYNLSSSPFLFAFDPPIDKKNTEELTLTSHWTFTNGTYREV